MSAETEARARAILERLVGFASVSDRSNLPLIDYVADYLGQLGVAVWRAPNAARDKAALMATIGPLKAASSSRAIPTSCRLRARRGAAIPSRCAKRTGVSTGAALAI
jgi:hypothetical protein